MTFARHLQVVAVGGMPGGERWSCSLALSGQNTAYGSDDVTAFAPQAMARWSTMVSAGESLLSTGVTLQRVDVRVITVAGTTEYLASSAPLAVVAGQGPPILPNQCAIVASLRTDTAGAKGRGRFFLPCLQADVEANGRISAGKRSGLVTKVGALLNGLVADANGTFQAAPVALVVASKVGAGINSRVTAARIGDVIDTQRRRRDALVEAYASIPIE